MVVCGDFNSESTAAGPNAIDLLLEREEVPKGFIDPATGKPLCSKKPKKQCFGPFVDAYKQAYGDVNPPATLVVPQLFPRMVANERDFALTTELAAAVGKMFVMFADKDGGKFMSRSAVDKWLVCINGRTDRGSEMRAAMKLLEARESVEGTIGLALQDFIEVYRGVLRDGKPWSVAYDLWATGCEAACLPRKDNLQELGDPFTARYDRIWFSASTLQVGAVRAVRAKSRDSIDEALPNSWSASDHLPLAATIELV